MSAGQHNPRLAVLGFFPDWGHAQPLIRIASAARAAGWQVRCYLPERARALAEQEQLDALFLNEIPRPEVHKEFRRLSRWPVFLRQYSGHMHANMRLVPQAYQSLGESLPRIAADIASFAPELVLSDSHLFVPFYDQIARNLGVPLVAHNPSGTLAPAERPYVQFFGADGVSQRRMTVVERLGKLNEKALRNAYYAAHAREWLQLRRVKQDVARKVAAAFPAPAATQRLAEITTSMSWVEQRVLAKPAPAYLAASFPPIPARPTPLDDKLEHWLTSAAEPVIYVSFGSMVSLSPSTQRDVIRALSVTGRRVLWSASQEEQAGLSRFAADSRFLFRTYVPQPQLLRRKEVGLFLTHGGANSVLEALIGGTPMVCVPFFADQPYIAWTVEQMGAGRAVPKAALGTGRLEEALRNVLRPEFQARADQIRKTIAAENGVSEVLDYLSIAAGGLSAR